MNLKEYSDHIAKLAKKYPNALVIFSSDSEGNSFQKVSYTGTMGFFEGEYHGEFYSVKSIKESPSEFDESFDVKKPTAICIN